MAAIKDKLKNVMSKDFHQQDFYMYTLTDIKKMR